MQSQTGWGKRTLRNLTSVGFLLFSMLSLAPTAGASGLEIRIVRASSNRYHQRQVHTHEECRDCADFEYRSPSGQLEHIRAARSPDLVISLGDIRAILVFRQASLSSAKHVDDHKPASLYAAILVISRYAQQPLLELQGRAGAGGLVMISVEDRPIAITRLPPYTPWELRAGSFRSTGEIQTTFRGALVAPAIVPIEDPDSVWARHSMQQSQEETRWLMACDAAFRREVLKRAAEEGHSAAEVPFANEKIDCSRKPPSMEANRAADQQTAWVHGRLRSGVKDGIWTYLDEQGEVTKLEIFDSGRLVETISPSTTP